MSSDNCDLIVKFPNGDIFASLNFSMTCAVDLESDELPCDDDFQLIAKDLYSTAKSFDSLDEARTWAKANKSKYTEYGLQEILATHDYDPEWKFSKCHSCWEPHEFAHANHKCPGNDITGQDTECNCCERCLKECELWRDSEKDVARYR